MFENNALQKKIVLGLTMLATALIQSPLSHAGPTTAVKNQQTTARVRYSKSKDGRYIYIRSATQLELNNPEQAKALGTAFTRIKEQIDDLKKKSPRTGNTGKIDMALLEEASKFDQQIDGIVAYMQRYYGELETLSNYANVGMPSAYLFFTGVNWSKSLGWSSIQVLSGMSVVMGVVVLPINVRRVEVDTGKVDEYFDWDTSIVFWPTGNIGLALPKLLGVDAPNAPTAGSSAEATSRGGILDPNRRFGFGFIWGRLDQASDFQGMISGISGSVGGNLRVGAKLQALTNWSKPEAFSNVFLTFAVEREKRNPVPAELHGSVGYIVDAASFVGAPKSGSPEEALAAAAARQTNGGKSGTFTPIPGTPGGSGPFIPPQPLVP